MRLSALYKAGPLNLFEIAEGESMWLTSTGQEIKVRSHIDITDMYPDLTNKFGIMLATDMGEEPTPQNIEAYGDEAFITFGGWVKIYSFHDNMGVAFTGKHAERVARDYLASHREHHRKWLAVDYGIRGWQGTVRDWILD